LSQDAFPLPPIAADAVSDNIDGMAAFSSRGPTIDQRIKPDVVAPGTYILSALSRDVADPKTAGWATSQDPLLLFDGGTSMATPLVAGSAAVIREYLATQHNIAAASAALVKALLINGANPIPGQYKPSETGPIPNNADGFGRIDLSTVTKSFQAPASLTLLEENTALDTGDHEAQIVDIASGVSMLKVTLVWTDPAAAALQNDLDLIVRHSNGQETHGNMPTASAAFDRTNNVEQVSWIGIPQGTVTVIVRAFHITRFPQSYALVIRTA
jgi:subtilisin family serine protease